MRSSRCLPGGGGSRELTQIALSERCALRASWRFPRSDRDRDVRSRGLLAPPRARSVSPRAAVAAAQPRQQFGDGSQGLTTVDRRRGVLPVARPRGRDRACRHARTSRRRCPGGLDRYLGCRAAECASTKRPALLQSARARARAQAAGTPLPRPPAEGRARLRDGAVQLPLPPRSDRYTVSAQPRRAQRALWEREDARRHDAGSRGVVSRRGPGAAMDSAAACLALSGAVPVIRKMEALDGAALLARRRVSDHLRSIRKNLERNSKVSSAFATDHPHPAKEAVGKSTIGWINIARPSRRPWSLSLGRTQR